MVLTVVQRKGQGYLVGKGRYMQFLEEEKVLSYGSLFDQNHGFFDFCKQLETSIQMYSNTMSIFSCLFLFVISDYELNLQLLMCCYGETQEFLLQFFLEVQQYGFFLRLWNTPL